MKAFLARARACVEAGLPEVLALRESREEKADGSYVTGGDLLLQERLMELVSREMPDARVVSEELAAGDTAIEADGRVVVIDPIDGTENFTVGFPLWGVSISCFSGGVHQASLLGCPELGEWISSGTVVAPRFRSRVRGLSSSLNRDDLERATSGFEYRILGCCVYNMMSVIRGSFLSFENPKGARSWDILAGLNLAREAGLSVIVDGEEYAGQYLVSNRRYRFKVEHR